MDPEVWLKKFLADPTHVNAGLDDKDDPIPVDVFAVVEVSAKKEITVPSIVFNPSFEHAIEDLAGSWKEALQFDVDCIADSFEVASEIRNQCIEALNNPHKNESMIYEFAERQFSQAIDLSQAAGDPLIQCSFSVGVRY